MQRSPFGAFGTARPIGMVACSTVDRFKPAPGSPEERRDPAPSRAQGLEDGVPAGHERIHIRPRVQSTERAHQGQNEDPYESTGGYPA